MNLTLGRSAKALLLASLVGLAGCVLPTSPLAPKDPGTVTVVVRDSAGAPMANVHAEITQPNHVGGFFRVGADTDSAGMRTFYGIPAGERPVEITPPAGYVAGGGGPMQTVTVVKDQTTTVTFTLVHQ